MDTSAEALLFEYWHINDTQMSFIRAPDLTLELQGLHFHYHGRVKTAELKTVSPPQLLAFPLGNTRKITVMFNSQGVLGGGTD